MARSILAILAGLAVIIVTSFGIEAAANLLLMRVFPESFPNEAAMSHSVPVWLFTFAYTLLCVVAGGYVTAWHALILGVIQSALTIPAMLAFADKAHLWGWILSMIVVIPAAWCGGLIFEKRTPRREPQFVSSL